MSSQGWHSAGFCSEGKEVWHRGLPWDRTPSHAVSALVVLWVSESQDDILGGND